MVCFQSTPTSVGRSLSRFVVVEVETAEGGRLSGWELTR